VVTTATMAEVVLVIAMVVAVAQAHLVALRQVLMLVLVAVWGGFRTSLARWFAMQEEAVQLVATAVLDLRLVALAGVTGLLVMEVTIRRAVAVVPTVQTVTTRLLSHHQAVHLLTLVAEAVVVLVPLVATVAQALWSFVFHISGKSPQLTTLATSSKVRKKLLYMILYGYPK
jgi:hypothetical protein